MVQDAINDTPGEPVPISRREAMQWVLAAVAASALPTNSFAAPATQPGGKPYGHDPNLVKFYRPGAFWPLTLTTGLRKTAGALADAILPKDEYGPAAHEVGVVAMIDEWISAPYPQQQADRPVILDGLGWLEAEAMKRFEKPFSQLAEEQQHNICDDICFGPSAKPEFKKAAAFFARFRSLAASAYYATPAGWQAIGYVGNVPLAKFDGPPTSRAGKAWGDADGGGGVAHLLAVRMAPDNIAGVAAGMETGSLREKRRPRSLKPLEYWSCTWLG